MNKAINIARFFVTLSVQNGTYKVHGEDMNRMIMSVLRGFGYDKDGMQGKRVKLKDGSYKYYVELHKHGQTLIIDPDIDEGFCYDKHPWTDEFKGRGRDPIEKVDDSGSLNIEVFLRALLPLPKVAVSSNRDDPFLIGFRTKDLRAELKRLGMLATYDQIDSFMKHIEGSAVMKGTVKGYTLDTGHTVYEWHLQRLTIGDYINSLNQKYVIKTQATG